MIPKAASCKRILVVEDVCETRDAIRALLETSGYLVSGAGNEDEAVQKATWDQPDLVLISLGGRPESILKTARRIRLQASLAAEIPIVVFSIHTVPEGSEENIGENIHVTRPDNFNQLRELLARLLRRSTSIQ